MTSAAADTATRRAPSQNPAEQMPAASSATCTTRARCDTHCTRPQCAHTQHPLTLCVDGAEEADVFSIVKGHSLGHREPLDGADPHITSQPNLPCAAPVSTAQHRDQRRHAPCRRHPHVTSRTCSTVIRPCEDMPPLPPLLPEKALTPRATAAGMTACP